MSKFLGIILGVVGVAALVGAAIGWRFPFLGQSRSSNELETAQQSPTAGQPETRIRTTPGSQPLSNPQPQPRTPTVSASPTVPTIDRGGTAGTDTGSTNPGEPVRALW